MPKNETPPADDLQSFINDATADSNADLDALLTTWAAKGTEFETGEFWKPEIVGDKLVIRVETVGKSKFGNLVRGVTENGETHVVGLSANLRSKLPDHVTGKILGFVYIGEQRTDNGMMKVFRVFEFRSFSDAR